MTYCNWMKAGFAALVTGLVLAACAPREEILPGERLDLRALTRGAADATAAPEASVPVSVPVRLPGVVTNADWTHSGGSAQHRITHPALGRNLVALWSAGIGAGNDRKHRITAAPVVAEGRIFTLDSRATAAGFSASGAPLWTRDLTPPSENQDDASGGGLAYAAGRLFVTSGFGSLSALDPATGAVLWTQRFEAPVSSAPTIGDGLVFVVAEDSTGWAIDIDDGRVRWQVAGTPTLSAVVGGAGPALTDQLVILPYPSGEVQGALRDSGLGIWSVYVAGQRPGQAYAGVPDLTGDPVVVGDVVYIGTQSGKVAAIEVRSGKRIWTASEGALSAVLPVDNALYLISDAGQLVRLDAGTGAKVWGIDLPYFTDQKIKRLRDIFAHLGPVLAGGRLIVVSDDGLIRQFDPASGALVGTVAMPGGAATYPVVAGGVLYVVTTDGKLHAFR